MWTTSGLPARPGHVPHMDATVVAWLKSAGAIVLGETNLPELLSGCCCCNPPDYISTMISLCRMKPGIQGGLNCAIMKLDLGSR